MDMMLPICPCARRFIQTKNPTSRRIGSSSGMSDTKKLVCGVVNLVSATNLRIVAMSSGGMAAGAVDEKPLPSLSSPVIRDVSLLTRTFVTSPACTLVTKSG